MFQNHGLPRGLVGFGCRGMDGGDWYRIWQSFAATHVARREGLPDPVPVTAVHPAASKTDETSWQAMVLEHLRIQERIVLSFDGEQTLLSRVARSALERHGLVWP